MTCNYSFLKNAGIKQARVEEIMDDVNKKFGVVILTEEYSGLLLDKFEKVIKGMPHSRFAKVVNANPQAEHDQFDSAAVEWQMLGDLLMANKLPIHKNVAETVHAANTYLKGEHSSDFNSPRNRRMLLANLMRHSPDTPKPMFCVMALA